MPVGTVKWFDTRRGFGFLVDQQGRDVFVHYSVIEGAGFRRLYDHDVVEYEATEGPKGFLATRVKRITVAIPLDPKNN
jgi:CspA family cold shock protein